MPLRVTNAASPSSAQSAQVSQAPPRNDAVCPSSGRGAGIRIGVVDSGWDRSIYDHRVAPGIGLVDEAGDLCCSCTPDDQDRIGHGTSAADLILQIAPAATIVPVRVFGTKLQTSVRVFELALRVAVEQELRLVNLSLGTGRRDLLVPLYTACERARRAGTVIVAAGICYYDGWSYPAAFEPVLGVAHAPVQNPHDIVYRPWDVMECGARGTVQNARGLGGGTHRVTGTSFGAPVVTGHIARLLEAHPYADVDTIRKLLAARVNG